MCPVFIENISSDPGAELASLKRLAQKILKDFEAKGDLNIILVSDSFMRKLNRRFTRRKGTTDVLSFSFKEDKDTKERNNLLGEIYISFNRAKKQAHDYQATSDQELKRLVAHGILHLLGYDHKTRKDLAKMRNIEEKYIGLQSEKRRVRYS